MRKHDMCEIFTIFQKFKSWKLFLINYTISIKKQFNNIEDNI